MAGPQRPASGLATRKTGLRAPTTRRLASTATDRSQSPAVRSATSMRNGQSTPSALSTAGTKRKERDFDPEAGAETNIHVVVRCRGRTEREVKENSGVAVATEGVKGSNVELSMGPNAVSNKGYHFDRVFSPAADQAIIYEDVVAPILNEMLSGYNCTIFAYGQTGTGKTYTMSGDMTDTLGLLSDNAGIIPRVLYSLFRKLEETDSTVKCSFIELYNEELRDLLSAEDNSKLKIFENESKKGHSGSTMVQGMEETYIDSAHAGIKLLQRGSHRRQVAATKCNDLSSRSHTVFTITVFTKRVSESGEENIGSAKLNLVDLAGSENIGRSGAENKRAVEAGLINKSLLTLGRVINALVDKSPHIPYRSVDFHSTPLELLTDSRESKLTRLLQDSLGGQTKTCIIATISNSRSNLEETISTLDYAFRAKNIRNRPQINLAMSKKTLLREYTYEIEKLKSDLIATRHRNGVYLSTEAYEEMTVESESRRIVNEEQRVKIEMMESNLKNKLQEIFALTSNFNNMKKDNEETRAALEGTNDLLKQTEIVLEDTRRMLDEEEMLRKAHQETEEKLHNIGTGLVSTLDKTVGDMDGLRSKLRRKSDLHALNRETWQTSTSEVVDVTSLVDSRVAQFQQHHSYLLSAFSSKIGQFVQSELNNVKLSQSQLDEFTSLFDEAESEAKAQTSNAHDEMNDVLEEIKVLRADVKSKVGEGLKGLSTAAARISKEVIDELTDFHTQLHASYSSLGKEFKSMFENMLLHLESQKSEVIELRSQVQEANRRAVLANQTASSQLGQALDEERANAEAERNELLSQIKLLIQDSAEKQASRLRSKVDNIRSDMTSSDQTLEQASNAYGENIDKWALKEDEFVDEITATRDNLKNKMKNDWTMFDERNASIQKATESVHQETVRIVDAQMKDVAVQMEALDDFVTKARSQNGQYHEMHLDNLESLSANVRESYSSLHEHFTGFGDRARGFQDDINRHKDTVEESVVPLSDGVRQPLAELRTNIQNAPMTEYAVTGETPQKSHYDYPSKLPRTESHETLLARLRKSYQPPVSPVKQQQSPIKQQPPLISPLEGEEDGLAPLVGPSLGSPSKTLVYNDLEDEVGSLPPPTSTNTSSNTGLREVDINVAAKPLACSVEPDTVTASHVSAATTEKDLTAEEEDDMGPPSKKHASMSAVTKSNLPQKVTTKKLGGMLMEGRENIPIPTGGYNGRRLRSRPST
ncbi:kinesin family protein [Paecilomyces variotii No. 5]|uniref:Kinesin family protein n=1 Tax=Byssochlamys spectabilis (strain No. 5 / NBRC 109023) TaxID=1356009 RepID=V5FW46_BYSSN|nr:kinesin family protein [Paecilomyces variotii No. 5]